MSFDGRAHRGYALVAPIHTHSNACAVGNAASTALAQAYQYGQTQARMIGVQTYRLHLDTPSVYTQNQAEILADDWVSVARFRRYIPAHATHALFDFWGSIAGDQSTSVYARITANDFVDTDEGDAINVVLDARPNNGLEYGSDVSRALANRARALVEQRNMANYGGLAMVNLRGSIDLSTTTLAQLCSITVEAYAVDEDTELVPVALHPYQVSAWWEVAGG